MFVFWLLQDYVISFILEKFPLFLWTLTFIFETFVIHEIQVVFVSYPTWKEMNDFFKFYSICLFTINYSLSLKKKIFLFLLMYFNVVFLNRFIYQCFRIPNSFWWYPWLVRTIVNWRTLSCILSVSMIGGTPRVLRFQKNEKGQILKNEKRPNKGHISFKKFVRITKI